MKVSGWGFAVLFAILELTSLAASKTIFDRKTGKLIKVNRDKGQERSRSSNVSSSRLASRRKVVKGRRRLSKQLPAAQQQNRRISIDHSDHVVSQHVDQNDDLSFSENPSIRNFKIRNFDHLALESNSQPRTVFVAPPPGFNPHPTAETNSASPAFSLTVDYDNSNNGNSAELDLKPYGAASVVSSSESGAYGALKSAGFFSSDSKPFGAARTSASFVGGGRRKMLVRKKPKLAITGSTVVHKKPKLAITGSSRNVFQGGLSDSFFADQTKNFVRKQPESLQPVKASFRLSTPIGGQPTRANSAPITTNFIQPQQATSFIHPQSSSTNYVQQPSVSSNFIQPQQSSVYVLPQGPSALAAQQTSLGVETDLNFGSQPDEFFDPNADRSYSFNINSDSYTRSEAADSTGKVSGFYTYTDSTGVARTLNYQAGADIGFQTTGGNLLNPTPAQPLSILEPLAPAGPTQFVQPAVNSDMTLGRGYTFSYDDHQDTGLSRQETANADGTISGSYTLPDVNGNMMLVRYRAGPSIGFVVENMNEVRAKSVPNQNVGPLHGQDQLRARASSFERVHASQPASVTIAERRITPPAHRQQFLRQSPASSPKLNLLRKMAVVKRRKQPQPTKGVFLSPPRVSSPLDKSFSFGFQGSSSAHQEKADVNGERTGSYTYETPDGQQHVVRYRAGVNGFEIMNADGTSQQALQLARGERKIQELEEARRNLNGFSYDTGSIKRQEAGNYGNQGTRVGSYSFKSPEGTTHTVRYTAGVGGFQIIQN